jgi:hypothetical protein
MAAEEEPAMVVIQTTRYRAKCIALGCGNVARATLRYADVGGRPLRQEESYFAHTTEAKNAFPPNLR